MGKGGCQNSRTDAATSTGTMQRSSGVLTLSAAINAIQLLTSTRWAEEKIDARDVAKREYFGDSVRTADGKIPWETVRRHCGAESCWIVVKNKVRYLVMVSLWLCLLVQCF
jgi:hypothetical protein